MEYLGIYTLGVDIYPQIPHPQIYPTPSRTTELGSTHPTEILSFQNLFSISLLHYPGRVSRWVGYPRDGVSGVYTLPPIYLQIYPIPPEPLKSAVWILLECFLSELVSNDFAAVSFRHSWCILNVCSCYWIQNIPEEPQLQDKRMNYCNISENMYYPWFCVYFLGPFTTLQVRTWVLM